MTHYLGPSDGSIAHALAEQHAWFDDNVCVIAPMGDEGWTHHYAAPDDEIIQHQRRMIQLDELTELRKPVSMDYCEGGWTCSWTADQHADYDKYLASDPGSSDPVGDHHGRNV